MPRVEEVELVMGRRDWQLMARPNVLRPLQALSQLHTLRVFYSKVSAASLQLDVNTVAALSALTSLTCAPCEGSLLGEGAGGEASVPLDLTPLSALRRLAVLNLFPEVEAIPGCKLQARALPASLVELCLPERTVLDAAACCALKASSCACVGVNATCNRDADGQVRISRAARSARAPRPKKKHELS